MPDITAGTTMDGMDGAMTHGTIHRDGTATRGTGIHGTETHGISGADGVAAGIGILGTDLSAHMARGTLGILGSARIIRVGVRILTHGDRGILSVLYGRYTAT